MPNRSKNSNTKTRILNIASELKSEAFIGQNLSEPES